MSGLDFRAERRTAQNQLPLPDAQRIGEVGITLGELSDFEWAVQFWQRVAQVGFQFADLEFFSRSCLLRLIE